MRKREYQSGFGAVGILLVVLMIGIVGVVGGLVYQHNRVKITGAAPDTSTTSNQKTTTTSLNTTPATYTSTAGGFSYTYPAGWKVTEGQVGSGAGAEDAIYINAPAASTSQPTAGRVINTNRLSMILWISTNPDSSPHGTAPDQSIQKLTNGINLWTSGTSQTTSRTGSTGTSVCPELAIINDGRTHFSYALTNGKFLALSASYCQGQSDTTTLPYQAQLDSTDWKAAVGIIQSIQFK